MHVPYLQNWFEFAHKYGKQISTMWSWMAAKSLALPTVLYWEQNISSLAQNPTSYMQLCTICFSWPVVMNNFNTPLLTRKHSNHVPSHTRLFWIISRIHVYRLLVASSLQKVRPTQSCYGELICIIMSSRKVTSPSNRSQMDRLSAAACAENCKSSKLRYRLSRILGTHGTTRELDR
jgi:hypothetical protein